MTDREYDRLLGALAQYGVSAETINWLVDVRGEYVVD